MTGTLYIVGTPIGNLADMTFRAVDTLKTVDMIACEDTRHSLVLLNHYEIKKPLISYHQHKEQEVSEKIINLLQEGKNIALITDAGMPCISDPGAVLVNKLYSLEIPVKVIPTATAVTSAMSLSGIKEGGFCFLGFLPPKNKDREKLILPHIKSNVTLVFYCSPHDINNDAKYLYGVLGNREVVVVKEITKLFETVLHMQLEGFELENPRGEYVLLVKAGNYENELLELTIEEQVSRYLSEGMSKKDAIKATAKLRGLPKDEVYKLVMDL